VSRRDVAAPCFIKSYTFAQFSPIWGMGLINGWAAGNSKQRQHAKISLSGWSLLRMAHEWMGPAKKNSYMLVFRCF
jgi:hypothetical protein